MSKAEDRNQLCTCYVGNLDEQVTEALLWELMLQAGPVVNVNLPKDRVTQSHQGFGFVEYVTEEDADYAIKIMNMIKLYGKPIRVNKATADKKVLDVGATLFIGNLDPDVDEKLLYDTFTAFGVITQTPKVARDPDTGLSKGYAFVSYDNFDSSDAAIEAMNNQFLMNKPITVSYAFKKDGKGERHGSAAAPAMPPLPASIPMPARPPIPMAASGPVGMVPPPIPPLPMGAPPYPPPGMPMFGYPQGGMPPAGFGMPGMPGMPPPPMGFIPPPGFPYPPPQQQQQWGQGR
ncbi:Splicing factor 3B subunit 4 [Blyttiomyces sp. JEL0837]|nr:Splicing factor 3B subunit 4 [Blyttiomyces sp. JEL0837]